MRAAAFPPWPPWRRHHAPAQDTARAIRPRRSLASPANARWAHNWAHRACLGPPDAHICWVCSGYSIRARAIGAPWERPAAHHWSSRGATEGLGRPAGFVASSFRLYPFGCPTLLPWFPIGRSLAGPRLAAGHDGRSQRATGPRSWRRSLGHLRAIQRHRRMSHYRQSKRDQSLKPLERPAKPIGASNAFT